MQSPQQLPFLFLHAAPARSSPHRRCSLPLVPNAKRKGYPTHNTFPRQLPKSPLSQVLRPELHVAAAPAAAPITTKLPPLQPQGQPRSTTIPGAAKYAAGTAHPSKPALYRKTPSPAILPICASCPATLLPEPPFQGRLPIAALLPPALPLKPHPIDNGVIVLQIQMDSSYSFPFSPNTNKSGKRITQKWIFLKKFFAPQNSHLIKASKDTPLITG